MAALLTIPELSQYLKGRARLFRMETLPVYAVPTDGDDYHRWVAGEPEPTWERKRAWMATLRAERAAGRINSRVRVLSSRPTDYERYACEWGYALNAEAGEDIRVLHHGEHDIPAGLTPGDFWVINDTEVVLMHYDGDGGFTGAESIPPSAAAPYLAAKEAAWTAAEPFAAWWSRHPELRRTSAA